MKKLKMHSSDSSRENSAEISKEPINRPEKKILEGKRPEDWNKDIDFRGLKPDIFQIAHTYYNPDALLQDLRSTLAENNTFDQSVEDLLVQVLHDWCMDQILPLRQDMIHGKSVYFVNENALIACFDKGVDLKLVSEIIDFHPLRVVFRDGGFASDVAKINVEQMFFQLSHQTEACVL